MEAVEDKLVQETQPLMGQRLVITLEAGDLTQEETETVPQPVHVLFTRGQDGVAHTDTGGAGGMLGNPPPQHVNTETLLDHHVMG